MDPSRNLTSKEPVPYFETLERKAMKLWNLPMDQALVMRRGTIYRRIWPPTIPGNDVSHDCPTLGWDNEKSYQELSK